MPLSPRAIRIILSLLPLCLPIGSKASAQPPTLSPPALLPGDLAIAPAAGDQHEPAVAVADDGVALVAWTDWRADRTGKLLLDQTGSDVYAARVAPDGALLDALPIVVDRGPAMQDTPRVAWNGANWLVTWHSQEETQFYFAGAVRGVRISPAGQVLDAVPIDIVTYDFSSDALYGLGAAGPDWVVVSQGTSAGEEDLVVRRVRGDGTLPAPAKKLLDLSQIHLDYSLARAGGVNLLTYRTSGSVLALRFDDNLNKLDASPKTVGGGGSTNSLGLASNGAEFLVTWGAYGSSTQSGQVRAARITPAGVLLDPGGVSVTQELLLSQPNARSAWDGTQWIVSWVPNSFVNGPDLRVARVRTTGQVLDVGGVSILPAPTSEPSQAVVAGLPGGGTRVAWTDRRAGGPFPEDVRSFTLDPGLASSGELVVSTGAPKQTAPCVVAHDQGTVVFFRSETSGSMRIVGQRLDVWGAPVDAEPFTIHGPVPAVGAPRADWNGGLFMVTWVEEGVQVARRVLADGTPLDAAPIVVQPVSQAAVDVGALNGDFLAVGVDNPTHVHNQSVFGVRISGAGVVLDVAPRIVGASFARGPRVTAFGSRWVVAWNRAGSHDSPVAEVASAFVLPDGTAQTNGSLSPLLSGLSGADVAVSGPTGLAVWSHPVANDREIRGMRFDLAGTKLDPFGGVTVVTAPEEQRAPAAGAVSSGFLTLFEDPRAKTFFVDDRTDVFGGRVDLGGVALDPTGFPVRADGVPTVEPSLAGSGERAVLAWAELAPESPYSGYRLGFRVLNPCPGSATASGQGCAGSGGVVPSLSFDGCASPGAAGAIVVDQAVGGGQAFLFFGQAPAQAPVGFGCDLLVAPLLPFGVSLPLTAGGPGDGTATLPFVTPAGLVGLIHTQAFVVDPGAAGGFCASNALSIVFA